MRANKNQIMRASLVVKWQESKETEITLNLWI